MVGKIDLEIATVQKANGASEYAIGLASIADALNGPCCPEETQTTIAKKTAEDGKKGQIKKCIVIFVGEFLGTAVLMFAGCLCTVQFGETSSSLAGALGFGFTVCMVISMFGPISGAHINPSVTLCAIIYGSLPYWMFLIYVPAQILGGLFGFGLLAVSMPWNVYLDKSEAGICMTEPLDGMEPYTVFLCEFFLTSCLILTCCGLWDKRSENLQDSGAVKFGMTVAGLSIAGGQLTGASMNPARSFAPAAWQGLFISHWIYWVAPLSASVCTTLFYQFVVREKTKKND